MRLITSATPSFFGTYAFCLQIQPLVWRFSLTEMSLVNPSRKSKSHFCKVGEYMRQKVCAYIEHGGPLPLHLSLNFPKDADVLVRVIHPQNCPPHRPRLKQLLHQL